MAAREVIRYVGPDRHERNADAILKRMAEARAEDDRCRIELAELVGAVLAENERLRESVGTRGSGPVLTVDEAAELCRVSRDTIYTWINKGLLPSAKVEGKRLIRRAAIDAFLADQERSTAGA